MADGLKQIADAIKTRGITEPQLTEMVQRVYNMGYARGTSNQKKITKRIKWRYCLLIKWIHFQLSTFSNFTRKKEYSDIINGILDVKDQFMYENNLNSSYLPKAREVEVLGEPFEINLEKEMGYLLHDIVGDYINKNES